MITTVKAISVRPCYIEFNKANTFIVDISKNPSGDILYRQSLADLSGDE